ncbi:hypothetical protein WG66_009140 [Moniliophthora roreri]|nr:hypothetical protein WG66_009140 [Moniliophthora roreri]
MAIMCVINAYIQQLNLSKLMFMTHEALPALAIQLHPDHNTTCSNARFKPTWSSAEDPQE